MARYQFDNIFLAQGWVQNAVLDILDTGEILTIQTDRKRVQQNVNRIKGYAIPGIVNSHSHAFQRALAGLTEYKGQSSDSFWTWRDLMYEFANAISPEDLYSIASYLYIEMLKVGYTRVAEFHYLHQQKDGSSYENPAEMSLVIMQAALESGIGLSILPVLYEQASFDRRPLETKQLRFAHTLDAFQNLLEQLGSEIKTDQNINLGVALHSLRAVSKDSITELIKKISSQSGALPIHIHISEQVKEVEDCLQYYGARPVEWLMQNFDVNASWCLIHATHLSPSEVQSIAKSKAVVGLCPTTEANLGDGFFPLGDYISYGGCFSIGSDSHVSISPVEELRWLEYGQRLLAQERNVLSDSGTPHCGELLLRNIWRGGALSSMQKIGKIEIGYQADIIVLDENSISLHGKPEEYILDSFIFNGNCNIVRDVMVSGEWCVQNYQHPAEHEVVTRFKKTIANLQAKL